MDQQDKKRKWKQKNQEQSNYNKHVNLTINKLNK